jgi:hypothetical protein
VQVRYIVEHKKRLESTWDCDLALLFARFGRARGMGQKVARSPGAHPHPEGRLREPELLPAAQRRLHLRHTAGPNTQPLYRCYSDVEKSHFAANRDD